MDNQLNGLLEQQAYEGAPKIEEEVVTEEQKECAKRFKTLSVGCFFYALFYTFCLYQNKAGITYPFFVGGTLCFFSYYFRRFGATAAKDRGFLMGTMMLLGILNCVTDSGVIHFLNRLVIVGLFGVFIIETFQDSITWRIGTWIKALMHLLFGGISQIYRPFEDGYWSCRLNQNQKEVTQETKERRKRIIYVVLGLVLSSPIVLFITMLLGSADALFYQMLCDTWDTLFSWSLPEFLTDGDLTGWLWMIICGFLVSYGVMTYSSKRQYLANVAKTASVQWDALIAIAFLSMFMIVYGLFCGIQIFGLFLGWMTLPEGYTYAEYARQGFFQLVFVCLFNIMLVLGVTGLFRKNKWLQILLTGISGCTYIMVISSAYRMILYIDCYQLTFLRVFVLWALVMIAMVLGGVICSIWKPEFGLFRYLLVTVVSGYLIFAIAQPDYWIARYNVNRFMQGEEVDMWYLTRNLSTDAAPVVLELAKGNYPVEEKDNVNASLHVFKERVMEKTEDMYIRNWNISRAYARRLCEKMRN